MSTTDERMARLPKWAQEEFARRDREIEHLSKQVAELSGRSDGSGAVTVRQASTYDEVVASDRTRVRFYTGEDEGIEVYLTDDGRKNNEGELPVTVRSFGLGPLVMRPHVSNKVSLGLADG